MLIYVIARSFGLEVVVFCLRRRPTTFKLTQKLLLFASGRKQQLLKTRNAMKTVYLSSSKICAYDGLKQTTLAISSRNLYFYVEEFCGVVLRE
jgi:hypothetical protein